jgi:hypothetical protein
MSDYGLKQGTPDIESVGPIAFGPDDVLFVADSLGAKVFAFDVAGGGAARTGEPFELENIEARLAAHLGCETEDVLVRDMAVHPATDNIYLSVSKGRGRAGTPLIVRIDTSDGSITDVPLAERPFASVQIQNAPAEDAEMRGRKVRQMTVTDMAYVDGTLFVAGMSNQEFSSTLRRIPFPFNDEVLDSSLEIFHVAHGAYETAAPINTFVPYRGDRILASYTCTPLVTFGLAELKTGSQAKGRTVAELGAGNQPLDMVSVDDEFVLVANSRHPLMKVACDDIDRQAGLTTPLGREAVMEMVSSQDITAGLDERHGVPRVALPQKGVTRLAKLNGKYVLMLHRDESGASHLRSYAASSL